MAQGDGEILNQAKVGIMGAWNLASGGDTIKMVMCSGTEPANPDGTVVLADLTQIVAANYAAATLGSQALTQDDSGNLAKWDAADVVFTSLGAPSAPLTFCALADDTIANDPVLCHWTLTTQPNGGNYTLTFDGAGIITLT